MMPPIARVDSVLKMAIRARLRKQGMTNCKSTIPSPEESPLPVAQKADQPKQTLLMGFGSMAQNSTPKYQHPYCNQNQGDSVWPRCPILEKVFNREMFNNKALNYTTNSFDDIFYPPKFIKPSNQNNPRERVITTIGQLIKVLDWWVNEKVEPYSPAFWFYNYSNRPCYLRVLKSGIDFAIGSLIKKYKFTQPAITTKLEKLIHNLAEKTTDWDNSARRKQESQPWIYKSPSKAIFVNPIEVKKVVANLLWELRDIDEYIKSLKNKGNGDLLNNKHKRNAETNKAKQNTTTTKRKSSKPRDIRKRFTFRKAQALFDGKDLGLPTGAELKPVEILKKLVKSFAKVVSYKKLDKNGLEKAASDLLRGKVRCINVVLQERRVPCKIESRRGEGYILTASRAHS